MWSGHYDRFVGAIFAKVWRLFYIVLIGAEVAVAGNRSK